MLANCSKCGQLFNKVTQDLCQKCVDEEEELLREAQDYLRDNRNASMYQLVDDLDLDQTMVEKWINTNRIQLLSMEDLEDQHTDALKKQQTLEKLLKQSQDKKKPGISEQQQQDKRKHSGMHFKRK